VQTLYFNLLGLGLLSFILTVILTYPLLLLLRKLKSFQTEREEGPESHKKKSGTPTMGGIGFVLVISALSFFVLPSRFFPLIGLFGGFALIGFLDDFLKIIRKQNQGLTFWQKMFLQIMVSSLFSFTIIDPIHLGAVSGFLKLFSLNYFWVYYLFSVFVIVGGANAANLTDGLDGLLAGAAVLAFICFGYVLINQLLLPASSFSFIVGGALLGFLFYNAPAKKRAWLFMGDVGSLPVGAALSGLAIMTHNEILLVVIAGLFIAEALSVIIQVAAFKLFKKRVFEMAPLHHHFELLGWSEPKVVFMFWQISFILALLGVLISTNAL